MSLLGGVRVLDFGSGLAGPYAAMMLADLGAEVTKIEKPRRGDLIRFTDNYIGGRSGYFLGINRGKRSVTIDVRTPAGQDIARKLCAEADVVVENFRPGLMDRWGLGYEHLSAGRQDLVYCSISAFGTIDGLQTRPGNDIIAQAYSGIMALTGPADGEPAKAGAPVTDVSAACMATIAILAALFRRQRTGQGSLVETSLIEAAFGLMPNYTPSVLNSDVTFRRLGSGHPQIAPYEAYRTADDRYVVLGVFHPESWQRLCRALDRPELENDPAFASNEIRVQNRAQLQTSIGPDFARRDLAEWTEILTKFEVPFSPVLEVEDAIAFFTERDPGLLTGPLPSNAGPVQMLSAPFRIDRERCHHPSGAPELGEATEETLLRLGLSTQRITELHAERVI